MNDNQFNELKNELIKTNENVSELKNEQIKTNENLNALTKEMDKRFKYIDNKIDETRLELIKRMNSVEYNLRLEFQDFREINSREHDIMKNDIQVGRRERKEIQDALLSVLELSRINEEKHKEYDRILNLQ